MSTEQVTIPDFSDLDSARVLQLKALLQAVLAANNPDQDFRTGPFESLVLHPGALLAAAQEQGMLTALQSATLESIAADPTAVDADTADAVLETWGVTRQAGTKAAGTATIVLSAATPLFIAEDTGIVRNATDQAFVVSRPIAAVPAGSTATDYAAPFYQIPSVGWGFDVPIEAAEEGSSGNLPAGTLLDEAVTGSIPGLVKIFVKEDLIGGVAEETVAAAVARVQQGVAVRCWGNSASILSAMQASADIGDSLLSIGIAGYGDDELLRGTHPTWPLTSPGFVDLHVKTSANAETVVLTKTCTLMSKAGPVGTWQFSLTRDDAPGFHKISKVLIEGADATGTGFATSSDSRSVDLSGTGWRPAIATTAHGVYSRYQTGTFQFADNITDDSATSISATRDYDVYVSALPLVKECQDFWEDSDNRPAGVDFLVKAAIPCSVTVALTVQHASGNAPSEDDVKAAVVNAIQNVPIGTALPVSVIINGVMEDVAEATGVTVVTLTGSVRRPVGTTLTLGPSTTVLTVTTEVGTGVGPNSVAFLCAVSQVTVTLSAV